MAKRPYKLILILAAAVFAAVLSALNFDIVISVISKFGIVAKPFFTEFF